MKRTTSRTLLGSLALALIVSACGSSDSGSGSEATTATTAASGAATTAGGATTAAAAATTAAAAVKVSGTVKVDGSSTVAPFMKVAAEDFQGVQSGVTVTVGTSGTGGGFEKFCNGETDISNASRPIKDTELAACKAKGITPTEFLVANDALTVVVNKGNTWAKCLTTAQLKKMWEPESKVANWNEIDPSFPSEKLVLFGAGTDSGTFDYFTEVINGKAKASRTDYSPSEDDNVTVKGVEGSKGAMGYFGFSYFEENASKLTAVEIDGGKGCVAPSSDAVQDGTYAPLGRPLFVYVSDIAAKRAEVIEFLKFLVAEADTIAEESLFVPLNDTQATAAQAALKTIGA